MSNCERVWSIPSDAEFKESALLLPEWEETVNSAIHRAWEIIRWNSDRVLWIVWPCSIDFEGSIMEYAEKLAWLRDEYRNEIEVIMRYYTWKPRTVGGWKGIQSAKPWEQPDIWAWLLEARRLWVKILNEIWVPLADEMLHTEYSRIFDDMYSYEAVGARSTENLTHRENASSRDSLIWMKNPTWWDLEVMVNSVKAWQTKSFYSLNREVYKWKWNDLSHAILRGNTYESVRTPNYDVESLRKVYKYMTKAKILNPSFIVDTNHDNSWKKPELQLWIMKEVIANLESLEEECPGITAMWKGFMTESYLVEWNQPYSDNIIKWKSLTDPCSSWEDTQKMAEYIASIKKIA